MTAATQPVTGQKCDTCLGLIVFRDDSTGRWDICQGCYNRAVNQISEPTVALVQDLIQARHELWAAQAKLDEIDLLHQRPYTYTQTPLLDVYEQTRRILYGTDA